MAYLSLSGSCCRESLCPSVSHSNKSSGRGRVLRFVAKKRELCSLRTPRVLQWVGKVEGDHDERVRLPLHQWPRYTSRRPAKGCM